MEKNKPPRKLHGILKLQHLVLAGLAILVCLVVSLPLHSQDVPEVFNETGNGFSSDWVRHIFPGHQRPPARFDHDGHLDYEGLDECMVCHHLYEDGKLIPDESSEDRPCSDCHQLESESGGPPGLTLVYHLKCAGCHDKSGKGPLTCGECHVRKPLQ